VNDDIFGPLINREPPELPPHLSVDAELLSSRSTTKSPEELDRLFESAREVYHRITSAPHHLCVCGSPVPSARDADTDDTPPPASSVDRPSLELVHSEEQEETPLAVMTSARILVVGAGGAGKTSFLVSLSDRPVSPVPPQAGNDKPDLVEFGSIPLDADLELYLFGVREPLRSDKDGQALLAGAIGAIVLVDTCRLAEAVPHVDSLRRSGVPYVIGLNTMHGIIRHAIKDVRAKLPINHGIPVKRCDARDRESNKEMLITLVDHAMRQWDSSRENVPAELRQLAARLLA
jgi:uncharacterized protein